MSISKQIKALLVMTGKKQADLAPVLNRRENQASMPKQSLSNKFTGERWSAADLVKIADFTGCKLAFILPNGERVLLSDDDPTGGVLCQPISGGVTSPNTRNE